MAQALLPKNWSQRQKDASDALCKRGSFRHLFLGPQKVLYDMFHDPALREFGIMTSRKFGKSFASMLLAIEYAYSHKNSIVRIVMPTLKTARDVLFPVHSELKDILPAQCLPRLRRAESTFVFEHNNSMIILGGATPENIESSRGPRSDLIIADEVAAWDAANFDYALYSVLKPQLATTSGKTAYLCTPPKNPDHPYIHKILPKLVAKNAVVTATVDENPLLTADMITAIEEEYGGRDNPNFQREFLCVLVPDNSLRLVPEFTSTRHVGELTRKNPLTNEDDFYSTYVSADVGLVDNTALLFSYFDHNRQKLVVLHEWVNNYKTLREIADIWKQLDGKILAPLRYPGEEDSAAVCDVFPIAAQELRQEHGLHFHYPKKTKVEDTLAFLRNCLENDKIIIHPDCKRLIWELNHAVWNEKRTAIERSDEQSHGDCVMALAYLAKRVDWHHRPGQGSAISFGDPSTELLPRGYRGGRSSPRDRFSAYR